MKIPVTLNPLLSNASDYVHAASQAYCTGDIRCVSDKVVEYAQLIGIVFISGFLGVFGVVSNVIHLIVFTRLGFRETINISLFALSVSDMGASILLVWVTICFNPLLFYADVDLLFHDIYYYTGMWPRDMFMMTTAFLTVFISTERYLCIFSPLKVKSIMTTKRVTSIVVAIYVIIIGSMLYNYSIFRIDWKWIPSKNRTMLGAIYLNYRPVEMVSVKIQAFYTFASYSIVSACTLLFSWKLKQRGKWRQSVSGRKDDTTSSVRDQQIIKMVTCVAVIFILCYFPNIVSIFLMMSSSEIDIGGKYQNLYILMECVIASVGAVNSSVNIFVYYKMMSKYKAVFHSLFIKSIKVKV